MSRDGALFVWGVDARPRLALSWPSATADKCNGASAMPFLINILRFLLIVFVVRLVGRGLASLFRPPKRPQAGGEPAGVELVRDRVCNTFVPRDRAVQAMIAGRQEHFCSEACRDRARDAVSRAS